MTTTINFDALDSFVISGGTVELFLDEDGIGAVANDKNNEMVASSSEELSIYDALESISSLLQEKTP